jgi:iron complex outermembrane receptor protein
MQAQFDGGPNDGNQINGVPEWLWAGSVTWNPHPAWTVSIEGQHVRDQYFDEANREAIGSYTLVNLALGWKRGPWSVEVRGRNLLDEEYVSTGFMAPAESGAFVPYHYPGAPRTAELLLRWRM